MTFIQRILDYHAGQSGYMEDIGYRPQYTDVIISLSLRGYASLTRCIAGLSTQNNNYYVHSWK